MRQPQYEMGATVKIPLTVSHQKSGYKITVEVVGTVTSVEYDHRDGSCRAPLYFYHVDIGKVRADKQPVLVSESAIIEAEHHREGGA